MQHAAATHSLCQSLILVALSVLHSNAGGHQHVEGPVAEAPQHRLLLPGTSMAIAIWLLQLDLKS